MAARVESQIVYPKEAGYLLYRMNVRSGDTVVEAGTGSGSFSLSLAHALFPTGTLHTFENRPVVYPPPPSVSLCVTRCLCALSWSSCESMSVHLQKLCTCVSVCVCVSVPPRARRKSGGSPNSLHISPPHIHRRPLTAVSGISRNTPTWPPASTSTSGMSSHMDSTLMGDQTSRGPQVRKAVWGGSPCAICA